MFVNRSESSKKTTKLSAACAESIPAPQEPVAVSDEQDVPGRALCKGRLHAHNEGGQLTGILPCLEVQPSSDLS